jgi:hypothetical protein
MARNRDVKIGIDYFSHDTDIMQDPKIKLLKAKHGLIGYAVYLRLLEEIYREKGYYLLVNDDVNILFCDENNLDYNVYILILNECILRGLFDEKMYKKYGILTSKRIQLNYVSATERRLEVSFYKEYLLIDAKKEYRNLTLNVNILTLNAHICRQIESKEKGKQIDKEIENKICVQTLTMTQEEYQKLIALYTKERVDEKIEYAKNYAPLTKKYKNLYLTLNNWLKKDVEGKDESADKSDTFYMDLAKKLEKERVNQS